MQLTYIYSYLIITFPLAHTVIHTYTYTSLIGLFAESFKCVDIVTSFYSPLPCYVLPHKAVVSGLRLGESLFPYFILGCPTHLPLQLDTDHSLSSGDYHCSITSWPNKGTEWGQFLLPHSPIVPIPITFALDSA